MSSHAAFTVITPQRHTPGWFRRWLLAPPPAPTIGRKRRARRARGRRIELRQALGHGHWFRVPLDSASGFRSKSIGPTTRIFNVDIPTCIDEMDSFPTGELSIEQWAAARRTMQDQQGGRQADV